LTLLTVNGQSSTNSPSFRPTRPSFRPTRSPTSKPSVSLCQRRLNFTSPVGFIGPCNVYIQSSSLSTTACGYFSNKTAANLYGGQYGLGLASDPSGLNEIYVGTFIQLDLINVPVGLLFRMSDVKTGGSYGVYGSNQKSTIGKLLYKASVANTFFNVPSYSNYRYIGFTSASSTRPVALSALSAH